MAFARAGNWEMKNTFYYLTNHLSDFQGFCSEFRGEPRLPSATPKTASQRRPRGPLSRLCRGRGAGRSRGPAGAPGHGTHSHSASMVTQVERSVLRPRPVHRHPHAPKSPAGPVGPGTQGGTARLRSPPTVDAWGGACAHARPRSPRWPRPWAAPCGPKQSGRVRESTRSTRRTKPKHGTEQVVTTGHAASQQSRAGRDGGRAGVRAGPAACTPSPRPLGSSPTREPAVATGLGRPQCGVIKLNRCCPCFEATLDLRPEKEAIKFNKNQVPKQRYMAGAAIRRERPLWVPPSGWK